MQKEPLRFNKDGKFKIMLLGDIHDNYDMKNNAAEKLDDTLNLLTKAINEL